MDLNDAVDLYHDDPVDEPDFEDADFGDFDGFGSDDDEPQDMSDVEADADTFRSIGWGTDEDYGYYGEQDDFYGGEDW